MRTGIVEPSSAAEVRSRPELLRRFLEAYWLRPENALWMALRSDVLSRCALERPCVDLSCGDGVFCFLHCGGVFDPAFDVFHSVAGLDRVRTEHVDMFDSAEGYQAEIVTPAGNTIDVGTDVKRSMLAKADQLRLYGRLIEHDNNEPLPLDDGALQTVYCNSAYWVTSIERFLSEIRRVTRPDGRIVLHVKLDSMRRYTLGSFHAALGDRFLDICDRGRIGSWPTLADRQTWESRFDDAGLSIIESTPFVTRTHAQIWDIGLRPIAPMLVKMTRALSPKTRASIKREWVELFCELLEPFCAPEVDLFGGHDEPAEIQYVLTPR